MPTPETTPPCKCSNADINYPILRMFECQPPETTLSCKCSNAALQELVRMPIPRNYPTQQMFECQSPETTPPCKCSNADINYPILRMFECQPPETTLSCKCSNADLQELVRMPIPRNYPTQQMFECQSPETALSFKYVRPHCLPDSRWIQGGRGDQKFLGGLLSDLRRLQLEASSDDRVGDQVVDPAHVDQRDRDDDDPRGRSFDQEPDVGHHQRPPLEDEDGHKDHHDLGGVLVPVGPRAVHPSGRPPDLDPDGCIGDRDCGERDDLDDRDHLAVDLSRWVAEIEDAPAEQDPNNLSYLFISVLSYQCAGRFTTVYWLSKILDIN